MDNDTNDIKALALLIIIGTLCVITSQPSFWVWLTL